MRQEFFLWIPIETIIHECQNDYYKALHNVIIDDIIIGVIEVYLPVALWLQKVIKSKKNDGINVKSQQHLAKENQSY